MPAVIAPDDFAAWLSADTDPAVALALLRPAPEDLFTCVPVSTRVNAVRNDDAGLLEPVEIPAPSESDQATLF
jgi:putative SOS response-associated peptidase YedK